jgi:hypothetical protein
MTYRGTVINGVVVLEGTNALPEGTHVQVEPVSPTGAHTNGQELPELRQTLLQWAGKAKGLPSDLALNHDHYLHGRPKR